MRSLFYKERAQGMYRTSSFALARYVADIPGMIIEATLFTVLVYFIAGLRFLLSEKKKELRFILGMKQIDFSSFTESSLDFSWQVQLLAR